jgi:hypothetical protein
MSPPTPVELDYYPHAVFMSDMEWNPQRNTEEYTVHDLDLTDNEFQHNKYHPDNIYSFGELLPIACQQDIQF